jgi:hypothetical protein
MPERDPVQDPTTMAGMAAACSGTQGSSIWAPRMLPGHLEEQFCLGQFLQRAVQGLGPP